jgi:hypothetical protein
MAPLCGVAVAQSRVAIYAPQRILLKAERHPRRVLALSKAGAEIQRQSRARSIARRRRALFETLEAREMLTVAGPVNTLLDVVDQPALYLLRDAIADANLDSSEETIVLRQD